MPEETKIPGIGPVKKKTLYWGLGGVAVIGGVLYWRHQAASAAAANTATTASTTDPNAIDPTTGVLYSQEASGNVGSFPYGGVSDYGGSYYGSGNIVGYDQNGNPIYGTGITGSNVYTTNADWATAAENQLQAESVDQATAATAISRILAGLSVTQQQDDLFLQAVGLLGEPPQGYPKPVKISNPNHHPPPATKVTIPNVVGTDVEQASQILSAAGLKPSGPAGVKGAIHVVTATNPRVGSSVNSGSIVKLSYKTEKEPVKR